MTALLDRLEAIVTELAHPYTAAYHTELEAEAKSIIGQLREFGAKGRVVFSRRHSRQPGDR